MTQGTLDMALESLKIMRTTMGSYPPGPEQQRLHGFYCDKVRGFNSADQTRGFIVDNNLMAPCQPA